MLLPSVFNSGHSCLRHLSASTNRSAERQRNTSTCLIGAPSAQASSQPSRTFGSGPGGAMGEHLARRQPSHPAQKMIGAAPTSAFGALLRVLREEGTAVIVPSLPHKALVPGSSPGGPTKH